MKPFFLLFFIVLFGPHTSHAKYITKDSGGISSLGGFKFRLLGGLKYQRATMMSKNDFVEKRSMNGVGADAIGGFSFGPLIVGGGATYTKFFQSTDKGDVSDTDTSGDLTTFQGVVGLGAGKLCLLARYYFKADYKLSQKTAADEESSYSKPDGSYGLSLMYRPGGRSFWSIDYNNINFTEAKVGSVKAELNDADEKINLNSFGITYGFMF